ncbi:MAG TPA: hypothetical protein VMS21_09960 [Methylomirabilota bacterium]|nr:hypothetical protein [Methylomirabilota bacterium]
MKSPAALTAILCLGLLLTRVNGPAADDPAGDAPITWLPLTQDSPPTRTEELRGDILTFLEPLRRKVFGDPEIVLTTAYFIELSPAAAGRNVLPSATSTNVDGTLAGVLSAAQFQPYYKRLRDADRAAEGVSLVFAPRVTTFEKQRANLSGTRTVQIDGTNAVYGQMVDLVPIVTGTTLEMRVIAQATDVVTNVVPATAETPATESAGIRTLFQYALEAEVPNGGGLAVWSRPTNEDQPVYLFLIHPVIQ